MIDKDIKLLMEAYMAQYISSPIDAINNETVFSQLESLLKDIAQDKTKEELLNKVKIIQEDLVELAEQLRTEDLNYFANRLTD